MELKSIRNIAFSILPIVFLFCNCSPDSTGNMFDKGNQSGFFTDSRDHQVYETVLINGKWWMAENLKFLPYVSPPVSDSGIYVYDYFEFDVNKAKKTLNYKTYGVLYNWAKAMALPNQYNMELWSGSDSLYQGICPDGWHLPSDKEWNKLELFLKTSSNMTDSSNIALKIKSDTLWYGDGNGNNETGFSALPSGFRFREGFFDKIGRYGYFWTSTQCTSSCEKSARYRYLIFSDNEIHSSYPSKKSGLPVRCIKN